MSHPNLSADGTITFDAFIGRNYTFGFAGDFGGGSLAVNFVLDGVAAPFPNSPLNGPGTFTAVAPGSQIQLVLSGSTDPDIEFSIAPVNSETPDAIGAITPAEVDAKIASLGESRNESQLQRFFAATLDLDSAAPTSQTYVGIGGFGDSMCGLLANELVTKLIEKFGLGGVGSTWITGDLMVNNEIFQDTVSGGAAQGERLAGGPGMTAYTIPVGGWVESANASGVMRGAGDWQKVVCLYFTEPGGGTLTFQVSQNGSVVHSEAVSTDAPASLAVWEMDGSDGLDSGARPVIRATASGATAYYIGCFVFRNRGILPISMGRPGTTLLKQNAVPAAALQTYRDTFNLKLLIHNMKEEDATGEDYATHLDRMEANIGTADHLLIGQAPAILGSDETPTRDEARSAYMRSEALQRGMTYIDAYEILRDYSLVTELGWEADGTHLAPQAWKYLANKILLECPAFGGDPVGYAAQASQNSTAILREALTVRAIQRSTGATVTGTGAVSAANERYFYEIRANGGTGTAFRKLFDGTYINNRVVRPNLNWTLIVPTNILVMSATGATGCIQVGLSTSATAINKGAASFGIDLSNFTDTGIGNSVRISARLWIYDGTDLHTSEWGLLSALGQSNLHNLVLGWNADTKTLSLYYANPSQSNLALAHVASLRNSVITAVAGTVVAAAVDNSGSGSCSINITSEPVLIFHAPRQLAPWTL
jgi:hypothetical protein